jgi:RNA ligase (TIGR02306 family)
MSTHTVRVVRLPEFETHPNADALAIVRIDGYQVVVRKDDLAPGDLAIFVEPDYVVGSDPLFAWLKEKRIKVRRFRGLYSQGLLVPAPEGSVEGEDVMERYGIRRYEPGEFTGEKMHAGSRAGPPGLGLPKYDIENGYRYFEAIPAGTTVVVTEKIHGCNARFVHWDGEFYLGSRTRWVEADGNGWDRGVQQHPWIREWCEANPGAVLFGELYGWVQDLRYGHGPGEFSFRAFDVWHGGRFMDFPALAASIPDERRVPVLEVCPYDPEAMARLADGPSLACVGNAESIREGVVVRPLTELTDLRIGRAVLKWVSNQYLERAA